MQKHEILLEVVLLPQYSEWQRLQKEPFTLWNYIDARSDVELAAAFSKLFYPDFVEIDGQIFLAEQYSENALDQWRQYFDGDKQKVEQMINHVHIIDLFNNNASDVYKPELYEYLGKVLTVCWNHALQDMFPTKQFVMEYTTDDQEYGPTITFYQAS